MAGKPPGKSAFALKSFEFRSEREKIWRELERLVERIEKRGVKSLSSAELTRLPVLYRATLSSLSVARSISLDRNVVDYLEGLAGRAYFAVYGTKRHVFDTMREFFTVTFPAAVRRSRWHLALSTLFLMLGVMTGFVMTANDQDRFYTFVDASYASGRDPSASTEELREVLYHTDDTAADTLSFFAMYLFTHNAQIGIWAFCLGFAAGVPVFFLMFQNGLILGAFIALYHSRGLGLELMAWLLPHGVTELLAVVLCGAAGLVLAEALLLPGRHRRIENLGLRGREAGVIVTGAVVMFFAAGLIEGFFRQLVTNVPVRGIVIVVSAAFWITYLGVVGRTPPAARAARAEEAAT